LYRKAVSGGSRADALTVATTSALKTFLMTDVEGSTRLWEEQRERMAASLAVHDAVLRETVEQHGGDVVKSTGDGILASFGSAAEAVVGAVEIQRRVGREQWTVSVPLRIRVAVHTGEAQARAGDYFGPAVNRTARLLSIGHGGQILLSAAAAELVRDDLPAELSLIDQGEHRLRGFDRPERVFQLVGPDLVRTFPPLRSQPTVRTNLPAQLTSFVGRRREMVELRELAPRHRLLTLVGVGGTGKTRLMLELAGELGASFGDGVWLAELASITDPRLVVGEVGRAVGISEEPGRETIETLTDFLRDKELLLLLDNCEHVIAAAAGVVGPVMAGCPRVTVFASSREALGIHGEMTYPVPSLHLPDAPRPHLLEIAARAFDEAATSEAVQLFVDRARAVSPSFQLDAENAPTVVDICRRLDGIPLAIELAAARVSVLSVAEIDARLGDRFRLLTGGRRSVLPRQQTLQALIDWSWNLLSAEDRQLLGRLSVFSGGWTLEAAAGVTVDPGAEPDQLVTLDGLSRLVDRSLVQVDHAETTRYRLLETIRQYARDRLLEVGEADVTRAAHFGFFFALAMAAERPLLGPHMIEWLHRLDAEVDNLRAALDWGMEADTDRAIRMHLALAEYWRVRSFGSEPVDRLTRAAEAALARPRDLTGPNRSTTIVSARIVAAVALAHASWGAPQTAVRYGDLALNLARGLDDAETTLAALGAAATAAVFSGAPDKATRMSEETLRLATELDDPWILAMVSLGRGLATAAGGDIAGARREIERATEAAQRSGNPFVLAFAALSRGRMAAFLRGAEEARAAFAEAAEIYRQLGDRRFELVARSDLGHALRRSGELDEAEEVYREAVREWQQMGNRGAIANMLESFAFIALARHDALRAAQLLGSAETIRQATDAPMLPLEEMEYVDAVAALKADLEATSLRDAWRQGGEMSLSEAVEFAIGAIRVS
jgi:predicted ATPase/class 3 adenylate cyclase